MRTNIEIDVALMAEPQKAAGNRNKKIRWTRASLDGQAANVKGGRRGVRKIALARQLRPQSQCIHSATSFALPPMSFQAG